jgi:hypothetical protein
MSPLQVHFGVLASAHSQAKHSSCTPPSALPNDADQQQQELLEPLWTASEKEEPVADGVHGAVNESSYIH